MAVAITYSATDHVDAARATGVHVDVVEAHAEAADDTQPGGRGQGAPAHLRAVADDPRVGLGQRLLQRGRVVDERRPVVDVEAPAQELHGGRVHELADDDPVAGHGAAIMTGRASPRQGGR
jgi:hypothetical protein